MLVNAQLRAAMPVDMSTTYEITTSQRPEQLPGSLGATCWMAIFDRPGQPGWLPAYVSIGFFSRMEMGTDVKCMVPAFLRCPCIQACVTVYVPVCQAALPELCSGLDAPHSDTIKAGYFALAGWEESFKTGIYLYEEQCVY